MTYRRHSRPEELVYCVAVVADVIVVEQIQGSFNVAEVELLTGLEPSGPVGECGTRGDGGCEGVVGCGGNCYCKVVGRVGWKACCEMAEEKNV